MTDLSRREVIEMLSAVALAPLTSDAYASSRDGAGPGFRIRTITAGINIAAEVPRSER